MSRIALILLALFAVAVAAPAEARRFITLGSLSWPPYFFDAADGEAPGFAGELLAQCVAEARLEARFTALAPEAADQALRSGELDAHVMGFEEGREGDVVYGRVPIFFDRYRPMVRSGSEVSVEAMADLDALRVGYLRDAGYADGLQEYLARRQGADSLHSAASSEELLGLLLGGQVDAVVALEAPMRWLAWTRGELERILVLPLDLQVVDHYVVASLRSPRISDKRAFLDRIDRCLLAIQEDGRQQGLLQKYGLQ
jgi:ABC-type amino acid transport substrate-binding protein